MPPEGTMKVLFGEGRRGPLAASVLVLGALVVLALTVLTNLKPGYVAGVVAPCVVVLIAWRTLLSWKALLATTILLILFLPIKRYDIPASLPFKLEPYRILIAFIALGWIASLLADPRLRLRKTGIDAPLLFFFFAILVSIVVNPSRVDTVSSEVNKQFAFFLSFIIVFYVVSTSIRRLRDIDSVVKWLVGGGAVLGLFALIERNTGYNIFNHLGSFLPLHLDKKGIPVVDSRGGHLRVAASAQHPIALGAAFAMLAPLGFYLAYSRRSWLWTLCTGLIVLGALITGSRTAVVMMVTMLFIFLWLRTREVKRLWPAFLPLILVVHIAAPGTIGTFRDAFFPKGGLIAQQQNQNVGSGRLATLGPALRDEWEPHAIFGEGFATRITIFVVNEPLPNGPILDDEWAGVLIETGVVGAFALGWMFLRFIRRAGRAAKNARDARGWLLVATVASVAGYAVGMFTYDAFSFIQVTFFMFIILGLGCSAWQAAPEPAYETATAPARGSRGLRPQVESRS